MRLPRQDTPLRLSAEPPAEAIARDEALLAAPGSLRFWSATQPAVVVGIGLRHHIASVVDLDRCQAAGVAVLERRAGGGALLLDAQLLCGAIALPTSCVAPDVTESYRWLGEVLVRALAAVGVDARRVEVAEARADVAALRASAEPSTALLTKVCYGALSPHEVVVGRQKLVGLAQVRRRDAALFQFGILGRDQAPLADYLRVPDEATREHLRGQLSERTVGLAGLTSRSAVAVVAAIADAMPCAP
jgi:lipoate-protein ligase A